MKRRERDTRRTELLFTHLVAFILVIGVVNLSAGQGSKAPEKKYEMKQYWMVFLKHGPHRDQDSVTAAKIQKGHLANINRLAELGKLLVAGPFGDEGDPVGIFIMDCKDEAEVKGLCATDPAIQAGRLIPEIRPWWTAKGGSFK